MLGQTRQYSNRNPTDAPVNLAEEERIVHGKEIFSRNTEDLVTDWILSFLFFQISSFGICLSVFFICVCRPERKTQWLWKTRVRKTQSTTPRCSRRSCVVIPQAKVENYSYTPSPEFKGTYEYLLTRVFDLVFMKKVMSAMRKVRSFQNEFVKFNLISTISTLILTDTQFFHIFTFSPSSHSPVVYFSLLFFH